MARKAPPGAQKAFNIQKMKEREKMMREKQRKEREEASEFCSELFSKRTAKDKEKEPTQKQKKSVTKKKNPTKATPSSKKARDRGTVSPEADLSSDEDSVVVPTEQEQETEHYSDDNQQSSAESESSDDEDSILEEQEQSPKKFKTMVVTTRKSASLGRKPPPPPPKRAKLPPKYKIGATVFESVGDLSVAHLPDGTEELSHKDWKDYTSNLLYKLDEHRAYIDNDVKGKMTKKERDATKNDGVKSLVQSLMIHVWRTTKFLNSEKELLHTTEKVLAMTKLTGFDISMAQSRTEGLAIAEKRALFIKNYKEVVRTELNNKRSYVMNQARKVLFDLVDGVYGSTTDKGAQPREMPTVEDMHKVVFRELAVTKEVETEDGKKEMEVDEEATEYLTFIFEWYYTQYLPCIAMNKWWGEEKHHKGCASTIHLPNEPNKLMVPPSTEAFALIVYDNCYIRWKAMLEFRKDPANKGKPMPKHKKSDPNTEIYRGKFTDGAAGTARYGGWNVRGRNLFVQLTREIALNRGKRKDLIAGLEMQIKSAALAKKSKKRKADVAEMEPEELTEEMEELDVLEEDFLEE